MNKIALIILLFGIILLFIDRKLKPIIKLKYLPKPLKKEENQIDIFKPMFNNNNIWLEAYKTQKIN